jgi:TIR domain
MDTHLQTPLPAAEVFVSYASQDRARVLEVVRSLEEVGVRAWVDRQKILGGRN